MRSGFLFVMLGAACFAVGCNTPRRSTAGQAPGASAPAIVEAGCATCIFDMAGITGCKLAVKIDGAAYPVTGSAIDDHGDAHASDGLCNASRNAVVEGRIDGDRFVATRFALQPDGR